MRIRGARGLVMVVSVGLSAGLMTSNASALVAPVSAGPPKPTHLNQLDFDGFFPSTTQIHVGDSVSWRLNGFHTISFLASGQTQPALIIPATANPVTGPLDAAGSPFWFKGRPNLVINPAAAFPSGGRTYTGSGYLNSGVPASPTGSSTPFVVKFTKAGTFTFFCLVHPGMKGVVKVLPKGKRVPTVGQDRAAANAQEAAGISQARKLAKVKPPTATVLAGNDGAGIVTWLRFFPQNLTIKSGTTVDFKLASKREVHTITIGPAAYTTPIEKAFTTVQPNSMGPPTIVVNPLGAYPSDPPPLPPFTGANHGNGFENVGILAAGGPNPSSANVTFTKPGVYRYECVIHPNMDGTITVTS